MASNKNITMRQFNGTDYDYLYPRTTTGQVSGLYDNIYTKDQSDGLYLKTNGSNAMAGNLNVGNHYLSNVANPVSPQDGATKQYVDNQISNGLYSVNIAYNGNVNTTNSIMGSASFNYNNAIGISYSCNFNISVYNSQYWEITLGPVKIFSPTNKNDFDRGDTNVQFSGFFLFAGASYGEYYSSGIKYERYMGVVPNSSAYSNYHVDIANISVQSFNFNIPTNVLSMQTNDTITIASGWARTDVIYHR